MASRVFSLVLSMLPQQRGASRKSSSTTGVFVCRRERCCDLRCPRGGVASHLLGKYPSNILSILIGITRIHFLTRIQTKSCRRILRPNSGLHVIVLLSRPSSLDLSRYRARARASECSRWQSGSRSLTTYTEKKFISSSDMTTTRASRL